MNTLPVQIVRFVEAHQPNIVECMMTDATGRQWSFMDKVSVFTETYLDKQSSYPQSGVIACEIVSRRTDELGRTICTINTERPWGVEAKTGETQFDVFVDQITTAV